MFVYPDYYKYFKCIGSACKHNCCIGWEIDIDEDTAAFYKTVSGEMGKRLRQSIEGEPPHFVLGEKERCPFLNADNLCDIITELGEEQLCTICSKHPRFENELPDRVEVGIGIACEEAARIILGKDTPAVLENAPETDDGIIILRDKAIAALQNREKPISERVNDMLDLCGASLPEKSIPTWAEILLALERLDEQWTELLESLRESEIDFAAFDTHMMQRQTEYEQFAVYLVYRHMANAPDIGEAAARAAFAALGCKILHALGALLYTKTHEFTFSDQVELARLFSSEIEYSDENVYLLLDELI